MSEVEDLQKQLTELRSQFDAQKTEYEKLKVSSETMTKDLEDARAVNKRLIKSAFIPIKDDSGKSGEETDEDPDADKSLEEIAAEITDECLAKTVMPHLTGRESVDLRGQRTGEKRKEQR